MEDQARRLKELKSSLDRIGDLVLWNTEKLGTIIASESKDDQKSLNLVYGNIVDSIKSETEPLRNIVIDLKYYFDRQNNEITAILKNSSVIVDTVKASVKNENERNAIEADIERKNALVTTSPVVESVGNVQSTGLDPELQNKLSLVLDSAAGFFKSWGNPVEVGAALTLPVVGALGVAFGGVVLTVNKLVDGITDIIGKVTDMPSGIATAVGGAVTGVFKATSNPTNINGSTLNSAILIGTKPILDQLTNIDGSIKNVKIENASIGVNLDPVLRAIDNVSSSISSSIGNWSFSAPVAYPVVEEPKDDISFKSRVISLLENPVPVEVIVREDLRNSNGQQIREDVFADAVRPLVRNQEAMYNMLSSSLRELSQAVATLSVPPEVGRTDRVTRLNDNVNMTVNDTAIELILTETRTIAQAIAGFRSDFGTFSTNWTAANSEKRQERTGGETVLSGD